MATTPPHAPDETGTPPILKLATELIESICEELDSVEDIGNLRISCRTLSAKMHNYFLKTCFTTARTDMSINSLERLADLSRHEAFATQVRSLSVQPLQRRKRILVTTERVSRVHGEVPTTADWEGMSVIERTNARHRHISRSQECVLLRQVMKGLTKLQVVGIGQDNMWSPEDIYISSTLIFDWHSRCSQALSTLAIALRDDKVSLKTLSVGTLGLFSNYADSFSLFAAKECPAIWSQIQELRLSLMYGTNKPPEPWELCLYGFLLTMPRLRLLDISRPHGSGACLEHTFEHLSLANLPTLRLSRLKCLQASYLSSFVSRHKWTLRCLDLGWLRFTEDDTQNLVRRLQTILLDQELNLSSVSLQFLSTDPEMDWERDRGYGLLPFCKQEEKCSESCHLLNMQDGNSCPHVNLFARGGESRVREALELKLALAHAFSEEDHMQV